MAVAMHSGSLTRRAKPSGLTRLHMLIGVLPVTLRLDRTGLRTKIVSAQTSRPHRQLSKRRTRSAVFASDHDGADRTSITRLLGADGKIYTENGQVHDPPPSSMADLFTLAHWRWM